MALRAVTGRARPSGEPSRNIILLARENWFKLALLESCAMRKNPSEDTMNRWIPIIGPREVFYDGKTGF